MIGTRALALAAALTFVIATTSACGSSAGPASHPTYASSSITDAPSRGSEAPTSPHPSGQIINIRNLAQILVPAGWSVGKSGGTYSFDPPGGIMGGTSLATLSFYEGGDTPANLDSAARDYAKTSDYPAKRAPNLTMNGATMFHLTGVEKERNTDYWRDNFGTVNRNYLITVNWQFPQAAVSRDAANKYINQVMSTFKLL